MPLTARIRSTLRALLHRSRLDSEMDAELRFHIEARAADLTREGLESADALRRARLEFGALDSAKERCRESRGTAWLHSLAQDVRFGLRMLRKSPAFTIIAILTLALGIGANTAIFSVYDSVVLRTLPVSRPHHLVFFSDSPEQGYDSDSPPPTGRWNDFSSQNFTYFRDHDASFADLAAVQTARDIQVNVATQSRKPESVSGRLVSGNFFSLLGLKPAAGRLLAPDDDRAGAAPVAVMSYEYWVSRFHGDPSVVGRTVEVNETPFAVVGVASPGFSGIYFDSPAFWLPLAAQPLTSSRGPYASDPDMHWLMIVGRLKPGVALKQAQAGVNLELHQILAPYETGPHARKRAATYIQLAPGARGISYVRFAYSEALDLLMTIAGIILLIVCANLANLLLSRATAREKEVAIRVAVGASRRRLVRQLLTESVLLSAIGGAVGVLFAGWGAQLCTSLVLQRDASEIKPSPEWRILAFTAAVSIIAGIAFGLVPALRAGRADLAARMKGVKPLLRLRLNLSFSNSLVIFQVAASLVLLVGARLFIRTLKKLSDQQLGFDENHVVLVRMDPQAGGYTPEQAPALYQTLVDRIQSLPGVRSATIADSTPFDRNTSSGNFTVEGRPSLPRDSDVYRLLVGPEYFAIQGIPILRGRDIGSQDRVGTPLVAVINETMAREFFPGANPIGKRFSHGSPFHPDQAITIVGVAADARYYSLRDPIPPMEFSAALQVPNSKSRYGGYAGTLDVRAAGDPRVIERELPTAISQVAPTLPVSNIILLKDQVRDATAQNRASVQLSSAFAALALLLACIGLYGTMAYRVSRRANEIGIRMTLGAQQADILWFMMRECLFVVVVGLALGIPISLASTRVIAARLFAVSPTDALTIAAAALALTFAALAACYIPARRATHVDPLTALRHE